MPRKGFVNACVNSPTEVPQSPPPSRCFLEKGSCGQMWLFPDASLCLCIFTVVRPNIGALSSGNEFWKKLSWCQKLFLAHPRPSQFPHGPDLL